MRFASGDEWRSQYFLARGDVQARGPGTFSVLDATCHHRGRAGWPSPLPWRRCCGAAGHKATAPPLPPLSVLRTTGQPPSVHAALRALGVFTYGTPALAVSSPITEEAVGAHGGTRVQACAEGL